ncbi:putative disease resistance protein RGA3 [Cocos nucifera]|uniref:Putative disease resistance protein RGA3 n=1 Tax=Cocos nucifera TaxID=13894 RepID=A0A8K0ITD4_COCNU|nr:putative disease resistance protein RGA3 [Cocos nucifera]
MGTELVIAGWFASAAINQLINLAFSYIKEHPVWLKMKEELKELHAALLPIRAVVEKVEKLQIINDCTRAQEEWLWQLKDAVDEANDVLDELEYHKLEQDVKSGGEKVRATTFKKNTISFIDETSLKKKLKGAVKSLVHVANSARDFPDLSNEHEKRQQQIIARRESGYLTTEDKVVGREEEKEKIVEWLKKTGSGEHESSAENVTVLPIVGLPGMGKTTLAQLVHGEGSFDLRMWVCVSSYFDVTGIMKKIIQEAEITDRQAEALSTLQKILKDKLQSKKFLLVLDDVWNDDDRKKWEDLLAPLKYGKQGSKILLTTRMNSVAEMVGKVMGGIEEPINLQGIEWTKYLELFNKHAFDGVNADDVVKLQPIGGQIAKKLGQSPLLAKTVGGMLNDNLSIDFWRWVLENGIFNSIQNEDFQPILRLSYIHLSLQLQHCFRYCSIFPRDYLFHKDELVRMWMAVGLIEQSKDKRRRPEDIGGDYFDSLLRKSFFNLHGKSTYYVIHDLLHEMVCSISEGECLGVDYRQANPRDIPTTLRHLFIMVDDPLVLNKVPKLGNLHSLVLSIYGHDHSWDDILNKMLKGFKKLRVLTLEPSKRSCQLKCPNAIGDLKHLRYLYLERVFITKFSKSVCKLYHLQTMIVSYLDPSTGSIMGKDMRSLINLRYLILPSEIITTIVEGGKLTTLQKLDEFHVRKGNGCNIGALKHLRELRDKLCIRNLENVGRSEDAMEAELLNKKNLRTLQLEWASHLNSTQVAVKVIDGLKPHSSLENLTIAGYSGADLPRWTQDLNMLESIILRNCKNLKNLPPLELPSLKFLSLIDMRALTEVSFTTFPKLEVLNFQNIPQLEKWSCLKDGPWFPCLKKLNIKDCFGLVVLPPLPRSLEQLEINNVGLTTLPRLWQCPNNDCESPSPSKLRLLKIRHCPKLTSLAGGLLQHTDHFIYIEMLIIKDCKELVHLPMEGFQKLISLRSLDVSECPRLQRDNAPHVDFFLPSSLFELHLWECTSITSLPSAEVFRKLEILHELFIDGCTELTSLGGLQAVVSLKNLMITRCPKLVEAAAAMPSLTSHPDEGAVVDSSLSLNILEIDDPSLLHLEPLRSLTSVQRVDLQDCTQLMSLPEEWLLQVRSSLQELSLRKAVRFLPASLKELYSLQELLLNGHPLLQSLPELPNSLKTLIIFDCDSKLQDHLLGQGWTCEDIRMKMKIFIRN